jgi:hypothetical protein
MYLPDDIINNILLNLKTYDTINFCQTNKRIRSLCNLFNINILSNTLKPKTIACNKFSTYFIKNKNLYKVELTTNNINIINLPNNEIPIYIISYRYQSFLILTDTNTLYFMKPHENLSFEKMIIPNGKITFIKKGGYGETCYNVITTNGIYRCDYKNNKITQININNEKPLFMTISDYTYGVVTLNGLLTYGIQSISDVKYNNIDDINDILNICYIHGREFYLTTTGLYTESFIPKKKKLKLPTNFKIKCIKCSMFEIYILTDCGKIYQYKNKQFEVIKFDNPIQSILEDNNIIIVIDNQNNYFRIDTKYNVNTAILTIQKININF